MDPPSPSPCPIAGRYNFNQITLRPEEQYQTRIRGVTLKPRVQVNCRLHVSELKTCSNDGTRMSLDADYCETVNYMGRPIGEYGKNVFILSPNTRYFRNNFQSDQSRLVIG